VELKGMPGETQSGVRRAKVGGAFQPKTVPMGRGRALKRFRREAKAGKRDFRMEMKNPMPGDQLNQSFLRGIRE